MEPLKAERVLIVEGVLDEPRAAARAERLLAEFRPDVVEHVDDDRYVCNCGSYSAPGHELPHTTAAIG